jgi:DNA repair protein RecO (recombination protein O)
MITIIRPHHQHTGSSGFATLELYPGCIENRMAGRIMAAARISETYVLRTYPFREADLIVSFFTRDQGKLRGVARRARKPKSNFGSGLERLSLVNLSYSQKETRELVNLNSCDLVRSQFGLLAGFEAGVALDYIAEVSDHLLPPHEANEHFFRLLTATLEHMHTEAEGQVWRAITYFSLWATRLSGFLPDLREQPKLSGDSREIAGQMLRSHIGDLPERRWSKETANDLRRFLVRHMEAHVERRFLTAPVIEAM